MNSVGIDISKGRSTIAVMRPFGEVVISPFEVRHTGSELSKLAKQLKSLDGETRVVMEATGNYHASVAKLLHNAGLYVSVINAKLVHGYGNNELRRVKTDRKDAVKLANYGLDRWLTLPRYIPEEDTRLLLKNCYRQYRQYSKVQTVLKNNLISLLDTVFPNANRLFSQNLAVLVVIGILALIVLITWVNGAERRIPVQYAKRQVGRKMYGGQASTLPMKVNMSGVLPIIFAQSIAMIIPTVAAFLPAPEEGTFAYSLVHAVDSKSVLYMIFYFLMIIAFSYFYATIQFNPVEISNNLKKNGGFIPGFRPGKPTSDFIAKVLNKVTLFGAIYLGIVAICPLIAGKLLGNSGLAIGGTSVIIVVGVALETVRALESQMMMRQYKGFLE